MEIRFADPLRPKFSLVDYGVNMAYRVNSQDFINRDAAWDYAATLLAQGVKSVTIKPIRPKVK